MYIAYLHSGYHSYAGVKCLLRLYLIAFRHCIFRDTVPQKLFLDTNSKFSPLRTTTFAVRVICTCDVPAFPCTRRQFLCVLFPCSRTSVSVSVNPPCLFAPNYPVLDMRICSGGGEGRGSGEERVRRGGEGGGQGGEERGSGEGDREGRREVVGRGGEVVRKGGER